ncbi:MAG TPA: hypothetical protein VF487_01795 [Chitinophagaceae bacterium]
MRSWCKHIIKRSLYSCSRIIICMIMLQASVCAQPPAKVYTIKNGKMYIQLSKKLSEASVDSFISQYELQDLALKQFFNNGFEDSLKKFGWEIVMNNELGFIITKALSSFDEMKNPADRIRLMEKQAALNAEFPAVSPGVVYGYNKFRDKLAFEIRKDSVVLFYLRNNTKASKVMLAGSFNTWTPDELAMTRTDSGWIAFVKLSPGKYWYKFIVNGNWTTDNDNRQNENDGKGNTNSVFYYTNTVFHLNGFSNANKVFVAGSFNDWRPNELAMTKTVDGWEFPIYLADGTHTYRFIVDGVWITDPDNKDKLPNELKDYNSVLRIGKPSLFKLNNYKDAKQVILTGSFNKWRKDELFMTRTATGWELPYTLGPGNYEYRVIVDGKEIAHPQDLLTINDLNKGNSYLILNANYTFRLKGYPDAKKVFVAGDFNDWHPSSFDMKKEGDEWVFRLHLSPGKHLYKFIVDGKWMIDPGNNEWERDEQGNDNSVLWIGQ